MLLWWLISATLPWAPATEKCSVAVTPHLAMAPVHNVRLKVLIERGTAREAAVLLTGPEGLARSSEFQVGARTTWVEWIIDLVPGEYSVDLVTDGNCHARDRMIVAGG